MLLRLRRVRLFSTTGTPTSGTTSGTSGAGATPKYHHHHHHHHHYAKRNNNIAVAPAAEFHAAALSSSSLNLAKLIRDGGAEWVIKRPNPLSHVVTDLELRPILDTEIRDRKDLLAEKLVVVYASGATVFVNLNVEERSRCVQTLRQRYWGAQREEWVETPPHEVFNVSVTEHLNREEQRARRRRKKRDVNNDAVQLTEGGLEILEKFDFNDLIIISHTLSTSAQLKRFQVEVDELMSQFEKFLNAPDDKSLWMKVWGNKLSLIRYIQEVSRMHLRLFQQRRNLDWSEAAWESTRYEQVKEVMEDEFEIEDRFKILDEKIDFINTNFKSFFDISSAQDGAISEKAIVLFFLLEILLTTRKRTDK
jgi:uncharacterized Rmd1/YagE family protein